MSRERSNLGPDIRRAELIRAGLDLCRLTAYYEVTRDEVAAFAGVGSGSVNSYFGTINNYRQELIKAAIETRHLKILADAITRKESLVQGLDPQLKQEVLSSI